MNNSTNSFNGGLLYPQFMEMYVIRQNSIRKIGLSIGYLSATTGGYPSVMEYYIEYSHTPQFIRCYRSKFTIKTLGLNGHVYYYDENQNYLGSNIRYYIDTTSEEVSFITPASARYFRIGLQKEVPYIDLEGGFLPNSVFQKRPSNGYQRFVFAVDAIKPFRSQSASALQEQYVHTTDVGMLHLPSNYTESGKATPLIIYLHGAANNYTISSTEFVPACPLAPEWDAAGYAQLDIDLIPDAYNNLKNNSEGGSSDDAECVISAYRWVVEHFNIRRDGVYLMGRSRGGHAVLQTIGKYNSKVMPVIAAINNAGANSIINYGLTNSISVGQWNLICASFNLPAENRPTPDGTHTLISQDSIYEFLLANIDTWFRKAECSFLSLIENKNQEQTPSDILTLIHNHPRVSGVDDADYLTFLENLMFKSPVPLRFDWCVEDTIQPWKANGGRGNYAAIVKDGFCKNLAGISEYREWPTVSQSGTMPTGVSDRGHWHELFNLYDGDYTLPNGVVVSNPSMARIEWLLWCRRFDNRDL